MNTLLWGIFMYLLVILILERTGSTLNALVTNANGGIMPAVANNSTDHAIFDKDVEQSKVHKWSSEHTKLLFLADRINTPVWKNPPQTIIRWGLLLNFPVWVNQKISIGDIFTLLAKLMFFTGIGLSPFVAFLVFINLVLIYIPQN